MDAETRDKVQQVYNDYLKDDPGFQSFYQNVSGAKFTRGPELRRGTHHHERVLEEPSLTPEAEQTQEKEEQQQKKVEKTRTLYDLIIAPRDQEEQIISAAARSGLIHKSDEKDLRSHEATLTNVRGLVDVLEQRAQTVYNARVLERERREQTKEAAEEKDNKEEKKETHSVLPSFEYGVMDEIQKSLREALVQDADASDGPQATPKEARDQAQQQKDFTSLPERK